MRRKPSFRPAPVSGVYRRNVPDGGSVGDVFQPLSAEQKPEVTKAIGRGAGVLCIHGNHNGGIFMSIWRRKRPIWKRTSGQKAWRPGRTLPPPCQRAGRRQ